MIVTFGYNTRGIWPWLERKLRWQVHIPLSFSQLTERDLLFLGEHYPYKSDIEFHTRMLLHLCAFEKRPFFGLLCRLYLKNDTDLIYTIISNQGKPEADWPLSFLKDEPLTEKTIIGKIELDGITYLPFSDGLRNISINEFAEAEKYLQHIISTGNFEALENLVAVLYKPAGAAFEIITTQQRAELFTKLPQGLKMAVYLQYRAQRNFMITSNKAAFRRGGSSGSPVKNTWKDIVNDLSQEFVHVEEVGKRAAWDVFGWMVHSTKRANELKQRLKSKQK